MPLAYREIDKKNGHNARSSAGKAAVSIFFARGLADLVPRSGRREAAPPIRRVYQSESQSVPPESQLS